jgi:hypothetical protein
MARTRQLQLIQAAPAMLCLQIMYTCKACAFGQHHAAGYDIILERQMSASTTQFLVPL